MSCHLFIWGQISLLPEGRSLQRPEVHGGSELPPCCSPPHTLQRGRRICVRRGTSRSVCGKQSVLSAGHARARGAAARSPSVRPSCLLTAALMALMVWDMSPMCRRRVGIKISDGSISRETIGVARTHYTHKLCSLLGTSTLANAQFLSWPYTSQLRSGSRRVVLTLDFPKSRYNVRRQSWRSELLCCNITPVLTEPYTFQLRQAYRWRSQSVGLLYPYVPLCFDKLTSHPST